MEIYMLQDLVEAFRDELSGNFEDLCIVMVTDDLVFDVKTFKHFIEVRAQSISTEGLLIKTSIISGWK